MPVFIISSGAVLTSFWLAILFHVLWNSFLGFLLVIFLVFVIAYNLIDLLLDWLLDYVQSKNETPEERKTRLMIKAWKEETLYKTEVIKNSEKDIRKIKNLAEKYISEIITEDKTEPTQEDYRNFYELIKENNIEVENDYTTSVPYVVRSLLYKAYLKINKKFPWGKEK